MTKSSSQNQGEQTLNQSKRLEEFFRQEQQGRQQRSLKTQAIAWVLGCSMLPVVAVGTVTCYLSSQLIAKQISQSKPVAPKGLAETQVATLHRQLSLLLIIETGVTSVLVGAVTAILAHHAIRSVLNAVAISTTMLNQLRQKNIDTPTPITSKNQLLVLETNLSSIQEKLADLLWRQEAYAHLLERIDTKVDRTQTFINITHRIRRSLNEEDVLKTTVEEVRKAIAAERVLVYGFDANWNGAVIAESVVPGFPKALQAEIKDPCFAQGYVEKYQAGRVQATNNIYEAGLTDCYLSLLASFGVKANLIVPILKDDQLFGLLIVHQCSAPRHWQQFEIDLVTQVAVQVGFALDHARLLQRINADGMLTQLLVNITCSIRRSLNQEDILKTTVEEVRKAIGAERVLIYGLDSDWNGTVIAESVVPGFPKALQAEIKDPCFAQDYVEKYHTGRVQVINNIYEAGLSDCYLSQLEPLGVKANLIVPILKDNQLFGLLIAHQCSAPRHWQQFEIDLVTQVAMQVGFALDHARLLNQAEQAHQFAKATSDEERQQKEKLQHQVSQVLSGSQITVQSLATEALRQIQFVTATHNQIQTLADSAMKILICCQQTEHQYRQLNQSVQDEDESLKLVLDSFCDILTTVIKTGEKVQHLEQSSQKLSQVVSFISHVALQIKLQVMNMALEASRIPEVGQKFAMLADKALSQVQQLNTKIAEIESLLIEIQTQTNEATATVQFGAQQVLNGTDLIQAMQFKLHEIVTVTDRMKKLVEELAQIAPTQIIAATGATRSVLEAADIAKKTSEQVMAVALSLEKLSTLA